MRRLAPARRRRPGAARHGLSASSPSTRTLPVLSKFLALCRLGGFGAASPAGFRGLSRGRLGRRAPWRGRLGRGGLGRGLRGNGLAGHRLGGGAPGRDRRLGRSGLSRGRLARGDRLCRSRSRSRRGRSRSRGSRSRRSRGAAVPAPWSAGLVTVVSVTVSDAPGVLACGTSWCEALFLSLSVISSNCPMPAKTPRSAWAGASLMRSLTCGTRMSHSPSRTGYQWAPGSSQRPPAPFASLLLSACSLTGYLPPLRCASQHPALRMPRASPWRVLASPTYPGVVTRTDGALSGQTERRVLLAKPRGYCAGVDRAVQAVEMALDRFGPPVYVRQADRAQYPRREHARAAWRRLRDGSRRGAARRGRGVLRARHRPRGPPRRGDAGSCAPSTRPARW